MGVRGISIRGELSISRPSTGTQSPLFLFCYRFQVVDGGAQAASSVRGWHEAGFAAAAFVCMLHGGICITRCRPTVVDMVAAGSSGIAVALRRQADSSLGRVVLILSCFRCVPSSLASVGAPAYTGKHVICSSAVAHASRVVYRCHLLVMVW